MTQPRTKFARPTRPPQRDPDPDIHITEFGGLNKAQPAVDLQPGETPNAENFIVEDGWLQSRSGMSRFADSATQITHDVVTLLAEHQTVDGSIFPIMASGMTVSAYGIGAVASWSTLSYVPITAAQTDQLSGVSTDIYSSTFVYEPISDDNWFVFTNNKDVPKFTIPSTTTYSDISDFVSVESRAKVCYSIDDRLCFFNCAKSGTSFPTRVRWSERGNPSKFSTFAAGFQDLMDMRGEGSGVAVREFDALLFSTDEIWVQRPRRDIFGFDFLALERGIGCKYPRTIVDTPVGTIFLANDFMFYIVRGNDITPIGQKVHTFIRDNIKDADYAFALYNTGRRRYEFYYKDASAEDRPNRILYFTVDNGTWMYQTIARGYEVSSGAETADSLSDDFILIDELTDTIDNISSQIDNLRTPGSKAEKRHIMVGSSYATTYRFRDEQFSDDGSVITSQWDSHAMQHDPMRKYFFYNLNFYYQASASGNFNIYARGQQTDDYSLVANRKYSVANEGNRYPLVPVAVNGESPQFRIELAATTQSRTVKFGRFGMRMRDVGVGY
jgi:hypothetical protein